MDLKQSHRATPAVWFLSAALVMEPLIRWASLSTSSVISLRLLQIAISCFGIAIWMIQRDRKSMLARCMLSLAILCVGISCSERILTSLGWPRPAASGWTSDCHASERNQLGFRGRNLLVSQDEYVVVLLGDSQVEAVACEVRSMPEQVLESALRDRIGSARVVSLGASGYGQDQQLLALKEYFRSGYRADLVVLWQTLENDVWNNTFPTHWPTNANPKPTFIWQEQTLTLHRHPSAFRSRESSSSIGKLVRNLVPQRIDDAWEDRFLPAPYQPLADPSLPTRDKWQVKLDARIAQGENLANDKHHLSLYLTPSSQRVAYGIELTRQLYRCIAREAEEAGAAFALFNANRPTESLFEDEDDIYFRTEAGTYHFSKAQLDANSNRLREGFDAYIVDVETNPFWVSESDTHLNPEAVKEVMGKLAQRLVASDALSHRSSSAESPNHPIASQPRSTQR